MIPMSLAEIADVVGGTAHGDAEVRAPAVVDSRRAEAGGLFVAIPGEHVDGHDFAGAALAAGAVAVLGSRRVGAPCVVVDDTVAALGRLGRHVVDSLPDTTVLALTGSQGKTGTKDYLAQVLATAGETVATAGNFNNEIGVPLTVLRATPSTRFLVVEMGARGVGHIAELCEIAPPQVAAVLNVGTAHLGEFGTREAIARAKGEILESLPSDGAAVLNADDPLVVRMATRTAAPVLTFGPGGDVDWVEEEYDDLGRPTATFRLAGVEARRSLRQIGGHQLLNATAAAALALGAGLDPQRVVDALTDATSLSPWRMEVAERPDGVVVINDAYNANPASMRVALDTLAGIGRRRGARTVAVLGEMLELGAGADEEHAGVGAHAAVAGVDVLLVVGEPAGPIAEGARAARDWSGTAEVVEDRVAALAWLRENIAAGDVVLVKASRGAALEVVAQSLTGSEENPG